ncbi:mitochondrial 2-oxoglutarate/malate carrier protein-like [Plodia interpunctella]|uniref:mitochondrial 2-oxoglutarate/malate carrier protein-like n=1 Tax=Plodia interpunctella TaxID=58824 RepID=UPI0023678617|nr:mitochondrial 2-oxoglutarate/malate carrier protein-like [Plodia interpunctella]
MSWCDPNGEKPFINIDGVIAGIVATCVTHPLDVLKLRLQVAPCPCTTRQMATQIKICEGLRGFYCGLSSGLLRQVTYTATRLSIFDMLCRKYVRENYKRPTGRDKMWLGIYAGLCGGFVGNPSEVVLVRRVIEGCQPPPSRCYCCRCPCTYYGTLDALRKIVCADGFVGLFRGTTLTLLRSMVLSSVYVGTCRPMKDFVKQQTGVRDPFTLCVSSAVAMSFVASILTSPIDVVKTFHQAPRWDCYKQREILQCLIRYRGFSSLWRGFAPYFTRMAIHTIVTFMVLESLTKDVIK